MLWEAWLDIHKSNDGDYIRGKPALKGQVKPPGDSKHHLNKHTGRSAADWRTVLFWWMAKNSVFTIIVKLVVNIIICSKNEIGDY